MYLSKIEVPFLGWKFAWILSDCDGQYYWTVACQRLKIHFYEEVHFSLKIILAAFSFPCAYKWSFKSVLVWRSLSEPKVTVTPIQMHFGNLAVDNHVLFPAADAPRHKYLYYLWRVRGWEFSVDDTKKFGKHAVWFECCGDLQSKLDSVFIPLKRVPNAEELINTMCCSHRKVESRSCLHATE